MKTQNDNPLFIPLACILSAAFFLLGKSIAQNKGILSTEVSSLARASSSRIKHESKAITNDAEDQSKVQEIIAYQNPLDRMRATVALAYSIPTNEIEKWLSDKLFTVGDGYDLVLFTNLLYKRWDQEDPVGAAMHIGVSQSYFIENKLEHLAKTQPQAVLDYLKKNPATGMEMRIYDTIAKHHPALIIEALRSMKPFLLIEGDQNYYYYEHIIRILSNKAPKEMEALLNDLPPSQKKFATIQFNREQLAQNFDATFQKFLASPTGFYDLKNAMAHDDRFAEKLSSALPQMPEVWRNYFMKNPSALINQANCTDWYNYDFSTTSLNKNEITALKLYAIQSLDFKNPVRALSQLNQMNVDADERKRIVGKIGQSMAQNGYNSIDQVLSLLDSNEERESLKNTFATYQTHAEPADSSPYLLNIFNKVNQEEVYYDSNPFSSGVQFEDLTNSQLQDFKNKLSQLSEDQKAKACLLALNSNNLTNVSAYKNELFANAIQYAQKNTDEMYRNALFERCRLYIEQWANTDPDSAALWLASQPNFTHKDYVQATLAASWMNLDYAAGKKWFDSLPASERAEVGKFLDMK